MKKARTWASILLAALLLMVMVAPAMAAGSAYDGKDGTSHTITETLRLESADTIVPSVTYKITLDPQIRNAAGTANISEHAYSGMPTMSTDTVTFGPTSRVEGSGSNYGRYVTGEFVIDFSGVTFFEPGVYRYNLTKTVESTEITEDQIGQDKILTNTRSSDYVLVYVANNDGVNTLAEVKYVDENKTNEFVNSSAINKNHIDRYQSSTNHLRISKSVEGTMASQSQYFPFSISLTGGVAGAKYEVTGVHDAVTLVNAMNDEGYNNEDLLHITTDSATQKKYIALDDDGNYSGTFWMKHGQSLTINNLPYGIQYAVSETNSGDYTKSVTGSAENGAMPREGDVRVTYKNTKNMDVPTGINLQTAGPIFGLLLVGLLLTVVMTGKRKEN